MATRRSSLPASRRPSRTLQTLAVGFASSLLGVAVMNASSAAGCAGDEVRPEPIHPESIQSAPSRPVHSASAEPTEPVHAEPVHAEQAEPADGAAPVSAPAAPSATASATAHPAPSPPTPFLPATKSGVVVPLRITNDDTSDPPAE